MSASYILDALPLDEVVGRLLSCLPCNAFAALCVSEALSLRA